MTPAVWHFLALAAAATNRLDEAQTMAKSALKIDARNPGLWRSAETQYDNRAGEEVVQFLGDEFYIYKTNKKKRVPARISINPSFSSSHDAIASLQSHDDLACASHDSNHLSHQDYHRGRERRSDSMGINRHSISRRALRPAAFDQIKHVPRRCVLSAGYCDISISFPLHRRILYSFILFFFFPSINKKTASGRVYFCVRLLRLSTM